MITIKAIQLHTVAIPYITPFRTSFGEERFKAAILVEVITEEGVTGWGEASLETVPGYGAETIVTGGHILQNFVLPRLVGRVISDPYQVRTLLKPVRGNHHAKSGVEAAVWDALARINEMRLADYFASFLRDLGHQSRPAATVGVSIGIQLSIEATIDVIQKRLDQGYKRIKLKIKPGWDIELARAVREAFPEVMLMLDANSAYTLEDADYLQGLDAFNLLMIEQPLAHDDIYQHGKLNLHTPICLDESIKSANDLRLAVQVGAIDVLNLKPARVGGYAESVDIYRVCVENDLPLWIGGMLETGVGRAMNVAFAALPGVTLPCDISATDRYFEADIAAPPFVLNADSTISVPDGVGSGVTVERERLEEAAAYWREHNPYVNHPTG